MSPWWLATVGNALIWARLDASAAGPATVFASSGQHHAYDDEDTARAALLDAGFRALDGLDEDDAAGMGLDLASLRPPEGDTDADLVPQMVVRLPPRQ